MPPLEHTHPRLKLVAHADANVDAALADQAFVALSDVVTDFAVALLARVVVRSRTS